MVDMYLGCKGRTHPEGTFILHGEQVTIIGNQVQNVLINVSERAQHALLPQPLFTQDAPPGHKQDVEISRRMHFILTSSSRPRTTVLKHSFA